MTVMCYAYMGCLKLVYDAAARGHDIPSHCADATVKDAMTGTVAIWLNMPTRKFWEEYQK